jgi:hypothetical protein
MPHSFTPDQLRALDTIGHTGDYLSARIIALIEAVQQGATSDEIVSELRTLHELLLTNLTTVQAVTLGVESHDAPPYRAG